MNYDAFVPHRRKEDTGIRGQLFSFLGWVGDLKSQQNIFWRQNRIFFFVY